MIQKLKYEKIANDVIQIDLYNNYSIIAMELFNYETTKYEVKFYIKENTVDILDLIEKQEKVEFETSRSTINAAILKHVATLLSDGYYDYYIKRYDYMMKCFDKGNELFEGKSDGVNDNKI